MSWRLIVADQYALAAKTASFLLYSGRHRQSDRSANVSTLVDTLKLGGTVIVLLAGGNTSTQVGDIAIAKSVAAQWKGEWGFAWRCNLWRITSRPTGSEPPRHEGGGCASRAAARAA